MEKQKQQEAESKIAFTPALFSPAELSPRPVV